MRDAALIILGVALCIVVLSLGYSLLWLLIIILAVGLFIGFVR